MGPTALLPLQKKGMLKIFSPQKSDSFGRVRTRKLGYQRQAHYLWDHRSRYLPSQLSE